MAVGVEDQVQLWLEGDYDDQTKAEIRRLQEEDPQGLIDAFYTDLTFGTGGLRGIMGAGTNRMNIYTVRRATQGLANYIKRQKNPSVLISYDCRNNSRLFAEETAKVLLGNGIRAHLFKELRPVPLVSFGVRHLGCTAGVMITASHNPPKYNGYKVYWNDGSQVLPPHDQGIIEQVEAVREIQMGDLAQVEWVDQEVDEAYMKAISEVALHPAVNSSEGEKLKVVYTPLHGCGITMVPKTLAKWGFSNVSIVKAQETPDGNFPTVATPNPEEHAAMQLGVEQLQNEKADILIGTDPDTDRIGVVCMHEGKPVHFNGNETAALCLEYICRALLETKLMPAKATCVKTIVTTELFKAIADHHKIACIDVLTGFKYIGEKMTQWEHESVSPHHFIFGAEESYGYLVGTHARDKDAVVTAALVCEMALRLKLAGKTLYEFLLELYQIHGVYRERLESLTFEGKEGQEKMAAMMNKLRASPPSSIGGQPVVCIEDYLLHTQTHGGRKEPLLLPKSNVLRLWLEDGTKIVVRPSGTEPKIKLYCGMKGKGDIALVDKKLEELLADIKSAL